MSMACRLIINKGSQDFNHINREMAPVHMVTQRDADLLVTLLGGLIEGSLRLCDLKFTSSTSIWISYEIIKGDLGKDCCKKEERVCLST